MKHQPLDQLKKVAEVSTEDQRPAMTRDERLDRWAQLLEAQPERRLATLHETEYQPFSNRMAMRSSGSPISVAFDDPVLRAEGLEGDSYGEAKRFFEIGDHELHDIVCYCHYGETVSAATAARLVRDAIAGKRKTGMFSRMHVTFSW